MFSSRTPDSAFQIALCCDLSGYNLGPFFTPGAPQPGHPGRRLITGFPGPVDCLLEVLLIGLFLPAGPSFLPLVAHPSQLAAEIPSLLLTHPCLLPPTGPGITLPEGVTVGLENEMEIGV